MTVKLAKILLSLALVLVIASQSFAAGEVNNSINNFALNAAKLIANSSKGSSFFFSPYSIVTAFGMAYAGSEGSTEQEIRDVMKFAPDFHKNLGDFIRELESDKAITSANRIWLRNELTLENDYKFILASYYRSTAAELDFKNNSEGSRKIINDWVSDRTNGRINDLLSQVLPDTQMILTNAVYFNAKWRSEFNEKNTKQKEFNSFGNKINVPMMMQYNKFLYAEQDGTKIIKLPYEGRMSMLVILPPEGKSGLEDIDSESFEKLIQKLSRHEVDLWLPKFRTEDSYELKDLFEALGVKLAFSDFADFSGITQDEKLKIDAIVHKTFIDVDEKKTEAAAASAVMMVGVTAVMPVELPKAEFHADRPFWYCILDNQTNTILFMGRQTFTPVHE